MDNPGDVAAAWQTALSADRPVVFEAYVTGDVQTIPPHITMKQAREFSAALVKGDPDEGGIIKQSFKAVVEEFLPHKGD